VRPRYIKETSVAMLAFSIGWLFEINSSMAKHQVVLALAAFVIRCLVTWSYWKGQNWARVLAMLYSGLCLIRLVQWAHVGMLTRELWMCEAALAIFLFVYLPQKDVSAWFTRARTAPVSGPTTEPAEVPSVVPAQDLDHASSGVLD